MDIEQQLPWQDQPAWYDLGLDDRLTLLIHVRENVHAWLKNNLTAKAYQVRCLVDRLDIPNFIPPCTSGWGFGPVLKEVAGSRENWITLYCPIPASAVNTCWTEAYAVAATLQVLFTALYEDKNENLFDSHFLQLVRVEGLWVERGKHGSGFSATVSPQFSRWVLAQPETRNQPEISAVIRKMYARATGKTHTGQDESRSSLHGRYIHYSCTGTACGLDPEHFNHNPNEGYQLIPHNIDTVFQLFALLAGLAKTCMLVREWERNSG